MRIKLGLAALACLVVTACVTTYEEVDATSPFGTLQFEKGYTTGYGFGRSTSQEYAIADESWACDRVRRAAFFTWNNDERVDRRIAAGPPARLVANTTYFMYQGGGPPTLNNQCAARATFTPEAGRTYRVVHAELSPVRCELQVIDTSTGAPPPDLELQQSYGCSTPTRQPRAS